MLVARGKERGPNRGLDWGDRSSGNIEIGGNAGGRCLEEMDGREVAEFDTS